MPLSEPAARTPIHQRKIDCVGYRRADGLWDIEGRLVDTKCYFFSNPWRSGIPPGEPVHEMLVRLTIDGRFTVVAVECVSDATPHESCGAIIPNFQRLVGLAMGAGWSKRVKERVGGPQGCAHHVELIGLLATVAFQTAGPLLAADRPDTARADSRQFIVDTCHVWKSGGEMAERFMADPKKAMTGE